MNKPFIFYLTCYENGFKEFVECVENSSAIERISFEQLIAILHEQEEQIYVEKGIKGLPDNEQCRYYVTISLLVIWFPALLSYKQVEAFHFWGSKEIRNYMSEHLLEFKNAWSSENEIQKTNDDQVALLDEEQDLFIKLLTI